MVSATYSEQLQAYQQLQSDYQLSKNALNQHQQNLILTSSEKTQQQNHWQQLKQQVEQLSTEIDTQLALRLATLVSLGVVNEVQQDTVVIRENIDSQRKLADERLSKMTEQQNVFSAELQRVLGQLSTAQMQLNELASRLLAIDEQWQAHLTSSEFIDEKDFISALLAVEERQKLQQLFDDIEQSKNQAQTLITQAKAKSTSIEKTKTELEKSSMGFLKLDQEPDIAVDLTQIDLLQIEAALVNINQQLKQLQLQIGQLTQQLSQDQTSKKVQQNFLEKITQAQTSLDDLSHLNSLIGSADGAKFRRFAQGLTLSNLVQLANERLERLYGRYQLQCQESDSLALEVLDTWQGDSARDIKTLSGGESFLISLALALALSDLVSSKTSIDSLFLDEGFGTLDNDTLEIALDALDNLNASGKMIGVISHVDALKERIAVQIKVKKLSGLGVSRLEKQFEFNQIGIITE